MSCKLTPAQFVQAVSLTASLIKLISASKETIIAHRSVAIEMDIFNVPLDENDREWRWSWPVLHDMS